MLHSLKSMSKDENDNDNDNDTQTVFSPGTFLNDLKNASMNEEHFVRFTRSNIMRLKKGETKQLLLYNAIE